MTLSKTGDGVLTGFWDFKTGAGASMDNEGLFFIL